MSPNNLITNLANRTTQITLGPREYDSSAGNISMTTTYNSCYLTNFNEDPEKVVIGVKLA